MVAKPGGVKSSHYIGMCATSLHNRQKTHRERHLVRDKHNVMVKHEVEKHNSAIQRYTAKLVQEDKGLLNIALREALLIASQQARISIYDRFEKGKGTGIVRTSTRQGVT